MVNPRDHQTYTMTLSKAGTAADNVKGTIRWVNQVPRTGPGETVAINPAPLLQAAARSAITGVASPFLRGSV